MESRVNAPVAEWHPDRVRTRGQKEADANFKRGVEDLARLEKLHDRVNSNSRKD